MFYTQTDNCTPICLHFCHHIFLFAAESEEPRIGMSGKGLTTVRKEPINREYVHSVAVYQKISNEVGRIDNFRALARKLSFLPTELDISPNRVRYF